jgi:hypothetical protein
VYSICLLLVEYTLQFRLRYDQVIPEITPEGFQPA